MRSIVYPIADRPDVEVNVAGTCHYGQLRMGTRHDDEPWSGQVTWRRAPGENLVDTFPAGMVRPFVDRRTLTSEPIACLVLPQTSPVAP